MHLFSEVSYLCSKITTEKYSTSFSSSIRLLHKDLRTPVYNIYGFVRFADEIVDTFHDYEQEVLLEEFKVRYIPWDNEPVVLIRLLYITFWVAFLCRNIP